MQDIKVSPASVNVIQERLTLARFAKLTADEQLQTVSDTGDLLKSKLVTRNDKNRLVAYLQPLISKSSNLVAKKIYTVLLDWDRAAL